MKILIVHNEYGKFSGEEAVVAVHKKVLEEHGHEVFSFRRSSTELDRMRFGKVRAFLSGIWNSSSQMEVGRIVREQRPDVVHIHNLFPWISPSVLPECRRAGVPVVMTVHNYRLVCPNGLHMPKGRYEVCEKCCGGREYWCVLRNCEQNYFKSLGYALRTCMARRFGFFKNNVTLFACLTEFQRERLVVEGYPADHLRVIPNMYPADVGAEMDKKGAGDFVAYVGRISPEKGIDLLLSVADRLQTIPFRLAGSCNAMPTLMSKVPANVSVLGNLASKQLLGVYCQSRFLVLCSRCFEGFPMAIVEAMVHGKAVIAPRIGGIPEIVEDGETGLLFAPGEVDELAAKIRYLWDHPELCRLMGRAGRAKALGEYSPEKLYGHLIALYNDAIEFTKGAMSRDRRTKRC
jgi:glycosyltransferase involved in cell wall biosynthesis